MNLPKEREDRLSEGQSQNLRKTPIFESKKKKERERIRKTKEKYSGKYKRLKNSNKKSLLRC